MGTQDVELYAIWHNHIASCYSTACRGSFTQSNATETYAELKKKYISLKALLNVLGVNLTDIDEIKE